MQRTINVVLDEIVVEEMVQVGVAFGLLGPGDEAAEGASAAASVVRARPTEQVRSQTPNIAAPTWLGKIVRKLWLWTGLPTPAQGDVFPRSVCRTVQGRMTGCLGPSRAFVRPGSASVVWHR